MPVPLDQYGNYTPTDWWGLSNQEQSGLINQALQGGMSIQQLGQLATQYGIAPSTVDQLIGAPSGSAMGTYNQAVNQGQADPIGLTIGSPLVNNALSGILGNKLEPFSRPVPTGPNPNYFSTSQLEPFGFELSGVPTTPGLAQITAAQAAHPEMTFTQILNDPNLFPQIDPQYRDRLLQAYGQVTSGAGAPGTTPTIQSQGASVTPTIPGTLTPTTTSGTNIPQPNTAVGIPGQSTNPAQTQAAMATNVGIPGVNTGTSIVPTDITLAHALSGFNPVQSLAQQVSQGAPQIAALQEAFLNPGFLSNFDITQDPSYQFRFNEGQRALEQSASAKGLLNSGRTARELTRYGQGLASTEYQAEFQRRQNLANLANILQQRGVSQTAGLQELVSNLFQGEFGRRYNMAQMGLTAAQAGLGGANVPVPGVGGTGGISLPSAGQTAQLPNAFGQVAGGLLGNAAGGIANIGQIQGAGILGQGQMQNSLLNSLIGAGTTLGAATLLGNPIGGLLGGILGLGSLSPYPGAHY